MGVHEAGHDGAAAAVDNLIVRVDRRLRSRADEGDIRAVDDHRAVLDHGAFRFEGKNRAMLKA